ncbi:MAG: DUF805 domain-containing protein [Lewinella sp.]
MFQQPFSFEGRIRRLEYGLTYLGSIVVQLLLTVIAEMTNETIAPLIILGPLVGLTYVGLAQGAKRCHDRGNSGWYQLIPLYPLWMLFAEGEPGPNKYGPNPKGKQLATDETILDSGEYV